MKNCSRKFQNVLENLVKSEKIIFHPRKTSKKVPKIVYRALFIYSGKKKTLETLIHYYRKQVISKEILFRKATNSRRYIHDQ